MASQIDICNLALSNIRAGSINSLTESSLQAQMCSLKYDFVLGMVLRENAWGFARTRVPAQLSTQAIYGWLYAYIYPNNCRHINRLVGEEEQLYSTSFITTYYPYNYDALRADIKRRKIPYEIFNFSGIRYIACNDQNIYIDYVIDITDPNLFPEDFILAFSHLLSSEIAVPIVGGDQGSKYKSEELKLYQAYINDATVNDMNEEQKDDPISDYELVRK